MIRAMFMCMCQVYLDITHEDPEERWPKKIYYGQNNCIKFSYTRHDKPNLKVRSARYRCKSYRTYCCTARLEIKEVGGKDRYTVVGEHSTNCYAMNGVKPTKHYDEQDDKSACINKLRENKNGTNDITVLFKKRCAELALDKIWLTPMNIWEIVRDELVGDQTNRVVIPTSVQVNRLWLYCY